MNTNTKKENLNGGLSKFSEYSLPQKESMQKYQAVSIPSAKKGVAQSIKEINQINSAKEQQKKEGLTDLKEREVLQQQPQQQQIEEQYHIPIGRQHTFNERKRAFSSPHPFYHFMRDSIHLKDQLIATPTFGDDDWKSRQLQNTKDKKDGINGCQSSPTNHGKVDGYDVFNSKLISNNSSLINATKESHINIQVMNNDSIGLQLKLGNHQMMPSNGEKSKRNSEIDLESYQFVDVNQSIIHQTPQLCPQQGNPNDCSSQSINALDSFEAGVSSSTALKHPKISKKSPLFEKFGQYPGRQRSPDSHYNLNNANLSAYNYPSINKQSSKYSNIYLGSNSSSSSLQNSQCTSSQQQIGIQTEGDATNDYTPQKKLPLNNLYNHQINTGRSASDKKQIGQRPINPVQLITAFNLRNNSEASILGNQQQQEKNLKINLNNTSSFLPLIDQPQSNILMSQQAQSSKNSNEVRILDRGFSEEGSTILSSIQRSNNLNHLAKYPLKRVSSIDDQSLSTCFTSIKASSPIKKNRNDIFNDFTSQNQKTQESDNLSTQQINNNTTKPLEDTSTHQLNLLQGDKLNFANLQPISKRSLIPPNSNQDRYEENPSLKYNRESIRKRSREQSSRHVSPTTTLDLLKQKKNNAQTPQTVSNTIGSLMQYATRDETIDDLLNIQLEKIEIKKQNSQKRSSPSLDYQRHHNSNPPSTDIPDDENGKYSAIPPTQINSYRQRKPNSIHVSTSEKQKRAESAKNKSKLNFFQNCLVKKDFYGRKVEPESAKFAHPGRKLSIKQNEPQSAALDSQKGKLINPQLIQQETNVSSNSNIQNDNIQKEIENLYNPQSETMQKQTEKIGMFHKQKEIYEQKYKRKMTANKEEVDLLKQLNTALEELKNVHTYSTQTTSNKNNSINNNIPKQNE